MKKWTKVLSVVALISVALAITVVILANVLVTPERVKSTLLPLAEEHLNRKIDFGTVEVSIFSGIEINGLKILEKNSDEVFVSTDLIRLKYQLLPLLAMKVVVDEVRLEKPDIRVARLKDGNFNFSDLLNSENAETQSENVSSEEEGAPISLLVSNIIIADGQLVFLDHMLNDKSPYRYQISALEVAAKGVSLTGKLPLNLQCLFNGAPLKIDGELNLLPFAGEFDVDLQNLDLVAFSHYLKDSLPGKLGGLKLSVKSAFAGDLKNIAIKGDMHLAEFDFVPDAMPEAALKDAVIDIGYDLQFNQDQELLHLETLEIDYNGIKVNTAGDVKSVLSAPELALAVTVPNLQLRQALNSVPKAITGDVSSLDPAGSLNVVANISGGLSEAAGLLKSATISMDSVQATAGGHRPALSGTLRLVGDELTSEKLNVRLGDNKADINLSAQKLFAETIMVNADVSSKRFELDPLMKGGVGSAVATDQSSTGKGSPSSKEELGPFEIPLHAKGIVKVDEAVWKGMSIKGFLAHYELKNNVLEVSRMDGQVAGGSFSNSARVDLGRKGFAYSARLGLKTIQADPLLTALSPKAAGSLLGALNLDMDIKGRGTQWETLSKKLNGQGDMLVADGRVVSPGLVKGFATFLQLPDMNEIAFSDFKGNIKIADGKLKLNSSITSEQIKLYPKGDIGLDGIMKLSLDTRLSPQMSQRLDSKGKVTQYLTDQDGWSQVPLLVSGDYASPRFGLDPKGLKSQAKKALTNELGKQLNKLLGGGAAQQQDEKQGEDSKDPAADAAGQLLQKLFCN